MYQKMFLISLLKIPSNLDENFKRIRVRNLITKFRKRRFG